MTCVKLEPHVDITRLHNVATITEFFMEMKFETMTSPQFRDSVSKYNFSMRDATSDAVYFNNFLQIIDDGTTNEGTLHITSMKNK